MSQHLEFSYLDRKSVLRDISIHVFEGESVGIVGANGAGKAIERFKPSMGCRFSTYASWWIRHAINRALADKSRTVRLPVHMLDATQKIRSLLAVRRSLRLHLQDPSINH